MPEIITEETPQMGKEGGDSVHQEGIVGTPNTIPTESIVTLDEGGNATITHVVLDKVPSSMTEKKKTGPKKATTPTKSIPASTLIEKLNEQIVMVSWIDGISPGDVPQGTTLSKAGRELLIELQKAIEALKAEYINKVQSL